MPTRRTQLNINIEPELLLSLKSQAIEEGKTLTEFVTDQLKKAPKDSEEKISSLEARLLKLEKILKVEKNSSKQKNQIGSIFTDEGAKDYGETAKGLFEKFLGIKNLTVDEGLKEILVHLKRYPHSNPELVLQILLGNHTLTGLEMTEAYRHGSCAMRSALNDWSENSLEELNVAFLNAVISKSLSK